ncbi:MAG: hypothetical protein ACLU62_03185 [Hydrogeniiclostridium sp.]
MKRKIVCLLAALLMIFAASCSGGSGESGVSSSASSSSSQASSTASSASSSPSASSSEEASEASEAGSPSVSSQGKAGLQEDGTYIGEGYTCKMPEGWRLLEEVSSQVTFVPENYPEESVDMVSIQLTEKDPAFDSYTQQDFEEAAEEEYAELDAFAFLEFEKGSFETYDMYTLRYSLTKDDTPMEFQQYLIDAPEKTVSVLFTEVNESDLTEIRDAFLENLKIQ